MSNAYVYILTNKAEGTLYTGVTTNLPKRIYEHKTKLVEGFSTRYNLDKLVYIEAHVDIAEATNRERQIKNWHRQWKINLITSSNPCWNDLSLDYEELSQDPETSSGSAAFNEGDKL